MSALLVEGLGKRFGAASVLDALALAVDAGTLLAVLGRSGSGKTTLLRLVAGFERPDAGRIAVAGDVVAAAAGVAGRAVHVPPERRRIGYVAQEGALFPHLTVGRNITFGLRRADRRARARVDELLELVGLPHRYAGRAPQDLSGGEQQRVALARALAPRPRLVLLDEPFSSLDAVLRAGTREAVVGALRAAGATALLVTHDQAEALSLGEQVAVLRDGRLVQVAAPAVLYREPADAALARFVGEAVLLPGIVRGAVVDTPLGVLPLRRPAPDGAATVLLRPEQLLLEARPGGDGPTARVRAVAFGGHDALLLLALADGRTLRARVAGHRAPSADDVVRIAVDGAALAFPPDALAEVSTVDRG